MPGDNSPHQVEGALVTIAGLDPARARPSPSQALRLTDPDSRAFALLDPAGVIVAANPTFAAHRDLPVERLVGRAVDELWTFDPEPGQPGELPELLVRVGHEMSVWVDARTVGEPGEGRVHGLHLWMEDGGLVGVGVGPTSADRRATIGARPPLCITPDWLVTGVVVYGLDGAIEQMNEAMYGLYGRTPEDMPSFDNLLVHRDDRAEGVAMAVKALCGEIDRWERRKRLIRPDGQLVWVEETVSLLHEDGVPARFLAQFVDISATVGVERALHESEDQVSFLTDGLPVALVEIDADGRITDGNAAARELLGVEPIGQTLAAVIHPDHLACVRRTLVQPAGAADRVLEFRLCDRDGVDRAGRWVRAVARVHLDRRGNFAKAVSTWTDITEEIEARETSIQLEELLESVQDLVAVTDADGRITYVNGVGKALLGEPGGGGREEASCHLTDLFAADSAPEINDVALSTARHFGSWQGEVRIVPPGMEPRVVSLSLVSHVDTNDGRASISAMARDITDLKHAEEVMRRQATTDVLTGLPNRAILFDRLGHALARSERTGGRVALLFIDLDRFKAVNDGMGHHAGDELLVQVADRLRASVRESDTVARIGGDEFVVLAEPVARAEDAAVVAQRIVASLARPFALEAGEAQIGASVGLAMSERRSTPRALIEQADSAVYQAKAAGRSRVVIYGR